MYKNHVTKDKVLMYNHETTRLINEEKSSLFSIPYSVKITKTDIVFNCILTVHAFINGIYQKNSPIPQSIEDLILYMYAKPIIMNIRHKDNLHHIFHCPVTGNWVSIMDQLKSHLEIDIIYLKYGTVNIDKNTWNSNIWADNDIFTVNGPNNDEMDYDVTFTATRLGLEIYSDEDGFNCIVGRCASTIARQKVTPGSRVVQVNHQWASQLRFENIRDAIKKASEQPPLTITFRIKTFLMRNNVDKERMTKLSFAECDGLRIGDDVDHADDEGRFLLGKIVDKVGFNLKVHYEGWGTKWDIWCDYKEETYRFAVAYSISREPNTRFRDVKMNDYIDIYPLRGHKGWKKGKIIRMDKYSGQVQVMYMVNDQRFLYWAHLNNPLEIR